MKISVVIPGFNEEKVVFHTIKELETFFEGKKYDYEIIYSDDGSKDRSVDIVEQLSKKNSAIKVVKETFNQGKGSAIKKGVLLSQGDFVFFTDADLAYPINQLDLFLSHLQKFDLIVGNRLDERSIYFLRVDLLKTIYFRHIISRVFNLAVRVLSRIKNINDVQCGFKAFNRTICNDVFPQIKTNGFCFDVELLKICQNKNLRILQVPVTVKYDINQSKVKLLKHPILMFFELLKISLRNR